MIHARTLAFSRRRNSILPPMANIEFGINLEFVRHAAKARR